MATSKRKYTTPTSIVGIKVYFKNARQLLSWLSRTFCFGVKASIQENSVEDFVVVLHGHRYRYYIAVSRNYLGAGLSDKSGRGADLMDGGFNRKTYDGILADILRYELST